MDTNSEVLTLSKKIYALRMQNNLNQKEMAKKLGIGVTSLRKIERGELPKRMGCSVLLRLCKVFDIRLSELFKAE